MSLFSYFSIQQLDDEGVTVNTLDRENEEPRQLK